MVLPTEVLCDSILVILLNVPMNHISLVLRSIDVTSLVKISEVPVLIHPLYTCPGAVIILKKVKNHGLSLKEYLLINLQGECDDLKHAQRIGTLLS